MAFFYFKQEEYVTIEDTAGTSEQTQPEAAPIMESAVEAPEQTENAPEVTPGETKAESDTPLVKEVDWESRIKDFQARTTRAEQGRAEERKARQGFEARLEAQQKYLESIMTDEDKEAYTAEVQSRTRSAVERDIQETRLQSLGSQIGSEIKDIADDVLALGVLKDPTDLKAALLAERPDHILVALTAAIPNLDIALDLPSTEKMQQMSPKEQADVVEKGLERLRVSARKELPKLHVNAVKQSYDSQLKELKDKIDNLGKEFEEKTKAHVAELAEARAVSTSTGGGGGGISLEEIQARHPGDPHGLLNDPDYKQLQQLRKKK